MARDNVCMICGAIIPEGRHICLTCEGTDDLQIFRAPSAPRTNGGRIRTMGDAELAAFLVAVAAQAAAGSFRDERAVRAWLAQPAKK